MLIFCSSIVITTQYTAGNSLQRKQSEKQNLIKLKQWTIHQIKINPTPKSILHHKQTIMTPRADMTIRHLHQPPSMMVMFWLSWNVSNMEFSMPSSQKQYFSGNYESAHQNPIFRIWRSYHLHACWTGFHSSWLHICIKVSFSINCHRQKLTNHKIAWERIMNSFLCILVAIKVWLQKCEYVITKAIFF